MENKSALKSELPPTGGGAPTTPGMTVVGWLILCFAVIPLTMAVHGDGRVYVTTGLVMFATGFGLVVMSRLLSRRGGGRGPTAAAT